MTDPYKVLGVSPDADDDRIKAAYRELARKYHPDGYVGNPLADLASEKMKEVNEAYDTIVAQRRNAQGQQSRQHPPYSGAAGSQFGDIRKLINAGRMTEAEELLDGVPRQMRDAEWFFLKGTVQHSRGWLDLAYENICRACSMNPSNAEYQAARNQIEWQRQTARPHGQRTTYAGGNPGCCTGCSACDVCATLYCADCCCECMGGDCIRCC